MYTAKNIGVLSIINTKSHITDMNNELEALDFTIGAHIGNLCILNIQVPI